MYRWHTTSKVEGVSYTCGYCGKEAAPSHAYNSDIVAPGAPKAHIYICPNCTQPTFFEPNGRQTPRIKLGSNVGAIGKKDVAQLYEEARNCTSVASYTAAVMVCRKILLNLAVEHKAPENQKFAFYVDFLSEHGFVPPQGKAWVKAIKDRGNDANHEIELMGEKDANFILEFTGALLYFNYELPNRLQSHNETKDKHGA
jgi:hypothetical protein